MRRLVISICSLALVSVAVGAKKEEKKSQPKKQAQTVQRAAQPTQAAGRGASSKKASTATHQVQNNRNGRAAIAASNAQRGKKNEPSTAVNQVHKGKKAQTSNAAYQTQKAKKNQTLNQAQTGKAARGGEVTRRGKRLRRLVQPLQEGLPKGRQHRSSQLNRSTSILQNSRILQRRPA